MSPRFPIMVKRLYGAKSLLIICESCRAEAFITPEECNQGASWYCPKGCGGVATFKYVEAKECPSCGKLGFFPDSCCSRRCALQVEYQRTLRS